MATDVPLLSSYKKDFVRRRLCHTLTGFKFYPGSNPCYSYTLRFLIWIIPGTSSLAASFIKLEPEYLPWILMGVFVFLFTFVLQIWSIWRQTNQDENTTNSTLDDEECPPWDGLVGGKSWSLLVPSKVYKFNVFLHSIFAGLLATSSAAALRIDILHNVFGFGIGELIATSSWLTVFITLQSVVVAAPAETATYGHIGLFELHALTRPFHLFVCQICCFIGLYYWNFLNIATISYILHAILPVVWLMGILPPLEPFLLWVGEQILVFFFGGSPAATTSRLILYLLLPIFQLVCMFFSGLSLRSTIIISSILGYILSTNIAGLSTISCLRNSSKVNNGHIKQVKTSDKASKVQLRKTVSTLGLKFRDFLTHLILLTLIIILSFFLQDQQHSYELSPKKEDRIVAFSLGWVIFAYMLVVKLFQEAQKVYGLFGLIRSPFYSSVPSLARSVCNNIFIVIHPMSSALVILSYSLLLETSDTLASERTKQQDISCLIEMVFIIRSFRWIWQNTDSALIEASIHHIFISYFLTSYSSLSTFRYIDTNFSYVQQMAFISFFRDRFMQVVEKIYLFLCLSATSIEDRPSRRSYAFLLFQMNLFFFPVIFIIIVVSSIISAPMLSFFTLPIFFVTFPRPARFWPGPVGISAATTSDSIYYEQAEDSILTQLSIAAKSGRLGSVQPESFFLLRHEDRIIWVQVLEKGNGYFTFSLRGMELQETSCHSLEATRIDDVMDSTFHKESKINHFLFHTLTPLTSLKVSMYSDTKNVLTGIINSKDNLK